MHALRRNQGEVKKHIEKSRFINLWQSLPRMCEISGGIHVVLLVFTAGSESRQKFANFLHIGALSLIFA